MGSILSFFGGSIFRMLWGEISTFITNAQEHRFELERMEKQAAIEAANFDRSQAALRLQSELGLKTIAAQAEADQSAAALAIDHAEADAWAAAISNATKPTGVAFIDGANGLVRPAYAFVGLALWVLTLHGHGWAMAAFDVELFGAIVGFFFADRSLMKRGK